MVKKIFSSVPRVGVKPQIHTFHYSDVLLWGLSGRFLVTVSGIEILYCILAYPGKATIKTEARQQAALNYKATRLQSEGTLGLDTTRVT